MERDNLMQGDVTEWNACDLLQQLQTGSISAEAVMTACLDRIERINPGINAIVSLRPRSELIAEAQAADRATTRGRLHGLPFAIKDLVEVAGLRSTHGSPIFADHVPQSDDWLAARIRAEGAILIGKTNVPEFGMGSHSYNPVHGVTRNPFDQSRSAGGSSGGAAAALAANLVWLADGSDMMGSLRNPAAFCHIYGLRPTYGLVSTDAVGDTFLHQLSTEGPMARTIDDLALLLDVLAGPNPAHPHALPQQPSFLAGLERKPEKPARIGWIGDWGGYYPIEPGILELCTATLDRFAADGCEIVSLTPDFDPALLWQSWITLRSFAIASGLKVHYDNPAERALLKPEAIWEIERGLALTGQQVQAASLIRSQWFASTASLFESFDALALPTAQVFPFDAEIHWPQTVAGKPMDTYHRWMEVVIPASLIGLPALSVPAGFGPAGLPTGLQLIGRRGADLALLQHAKSALRDQPDLG